MHVLSFTAEVFIVGVNPYVYLPEAVLSEIFKQAKKDSGPLPVKGKVNGKEFIQTLVKYQGAWRLYINGIMRKAAGVAVGDRVHIEVMYDPTSREMPMHPKFMQALNKNKKAKVAFEKYSPSRQKEINRYLGFTKTEETLDKNIDKIIRHLSGEKVRYFVLLRNKS